MLHTRISGVDSALTSTASPQAQATANHMYVRTLNIRHEQIEGGIGHILGAEGSILGAEGSSKDLQREAQQGDGEREKRGNREREREFLE